MKDCGHKVPGKARRAKPGCKCDRCEEVRAERREQRKVANITPAQRERKNAAQRVEGISAERQERRNAAQRVENMTAAQLKKLRAAGAARSKLFRQRQAQKEGA